MEVQEECIYLVQISASSNNNIIKIVEQNCQNHGTQVSLFNLGSSPDSTNLNKTSLMCEA